MQNVNSQQVKPCVLNTETTGSQFLINPEAVSAERKLKTKWNQKRADKLKLARKLNLSLGHALNKYMEETYTINKQDRPDHLKHLASDLFNYSGSSQTTLFREHTDGGIQYIATIHSKNRFDHVTNRERSVRLRKNWRHYFTENMKSGYTGVQTNKKEVRKAAKDGVVMEPEYLEKKFFKECDFMHLVLTVPHPNGIWKGQDFYAKDLISAFNAMRREKFFKDYVFGGEFSLEVTRKHDSGFHIHIHAMLIVNRGLRNRNILNAEILKAWNKHTVDPDSPTKEFSVEQQKAMFNSLYEGAKCTYYRKQGASYIPKDENIPAELQQRFSRQAGEELAAMDPQGATFTHLENLFITSPFKPKGEDGTNGKRWIWDEGLKLWKHYINQPVNLNSLSQEEQEDHINDMMAGVMECLKYHFDLKSIKDENGEWDCALLDDLIPKIKGVRTYQAFGNLYGVKELAATVKPEKDIPESATEQDELRDEELGEVFNPNSFENADRSEYNYILADASKIFMEDEGDGPIRIARANKYYFKREPISMQECLKLLNNAANKREIDLTALIFQEMAPALAG